MQNLMCTSALLFIGVRRHCGCHNCISYSCLVMALLLSIVREDERTQVEYLGRRGNYIDRSAVIKHVFKAIKSPAIGISSVYPTITSFFRPSSAIPSLCMRLSSCQSTKVLACCAEISNEILWLPRILSIAHHSFLTLLNRSLGRWRCSLWLLDFEKRVD